MAGWGEDGGGGRWGDPPYARDTMPAIKALVLSYNRDLSQLIGSYF